MADNTEQYQGLPIKHINEAIEEAKLNIDKERKGEQLGLYCRWNGMNRAMGKYWRFNHITLLAAPSGHGKSFAVNQLIDDFTATKSVFHPKTGEKIWTAPNENFKGELIWIHFGFEIPASDEILRNVSAKTSRSYHNLLSSEWDYENNRYNLISDEEFKDIVNQMNYLKDRPIFYVEISGTVAQIYYTIKYVREQHPNANIGYSLDHYLLTRKVGGESDMEMVGLLAHTLLYTRQQFQCLGIVVGQLNNDIKSKERRTKPGLHHPLDSDIYYGSQLNWICDNIWIFPYRPELLHIPKYGVDAINTDRLVIAACVKSRKGNIGEVYMDEHLAQGQFVERTDV